MIQKEIKEDFSDKSETKTVNEIVESCNIKARLIQLGCIEVDPSIEKFVVSQKGLKIYNEFICKIKSHLLQDLFIFFSEKYNINLSDNELREFIHFAKAHKNNEIEGKQKNGI